MKHKPHNRTHFGYREVGESEKTRLVGDVFRSVADKYDLMNDLMSFGAHRLWKRFAVARAGVRRGDKVLDVATGSGDLAVQFAAEVGDAGMVVMTDLSEPMLRRGRERMLDCGHAGNVWYVRSDAEQLPFADDTFDCVSISFGLRNVTRMERALVSMRRLLVPGGRLLVLEFSKPAVPLAKLYDKYSFGVVPGLGALVTGDRASYQYLVESIRRHPDQKTLRSMMLNAGLDRVDYFNLAGGVVALHVGLKY